MAAAYCDLSAADEDDDDELDEEEGASPVAAAAAPVRNGKRAGTEKQRRRRRVDVAQWSDSAVRMLVGVLRLLRYNSVVATQHEGEGLVGDKSNKQIWKWVARALQIRGHNFDAVQCKTKFKGLKAEYLAESRGPECWRELLEIPDELRDKASKFKFFTDMRDYFLGSPVIHSEGLFEGQTPEEFLQCLRTEAYACQPKALKRKNPRPADVATEPCFHPPIQLDWYHRRKEEHSAKKLQIAEKKLQLAEQKLQLELIRAENERQKLENESRKIDLEERRMKLHEEQLLSTNNILNSVLGCCLSHKNNAIFQ